MNFETKDVGRLWMAKEAFKEAYYVLCLGPAVGSATWFMLMLAGAGIAQGAALTFPVLGFGIGGTISLLRLWARFAAINKGWGKDETSVTRSGRPAPEKGSGIEQSLWISNHIYTKRTDRLRNMIVPRDLELCGLERQIDALAKTIAHEREYHLDLKDNFGKNVNRATRTYRREIRRLEVEKENLTIENMGYLFSIGPKPRLAGVIVLSRGEIKSNRSRVDWAEGLIEQISDEHDGRNSWLMNYGIRPVAQAIRALEEGKDRAMEWDDDTKSLRGAGEAKPIDVPYTTGALSDDEAIKDARP